MFLTSILCQQQLSVSMIFLINVFSFININMIRTKPSSRVCIKYLKMFVNNTHPLGATELINHRQLTTYTKIECKH